MNKRIIIAVAIVAIVVVAAVSYVILTKTDKELPISIENVGGRYNVTLSFFKDWTQIDYVDETENHSEHYFEPQMRTGLDWIRNSTPENTTFMCWWDYGHMIKGYAERNVIVRNPSHEWIDMVAIARTDPNAIKEFDPNEKLVDVANALTTSNYTETLQIMEKYGAAYVVIYKDDGPQVGKAWWMFKVAGLNPTSYQVKLENSTQVFNDAGKQTMLSKLLDNRDTGFTLVYQDESMKVYKID
jgi:asparagine N-glycosylation enzyme membrane subunit Stt3